MKNFLKRRKTFRFFLRSGEHFDIKAHNVSLVWKTDHSEFVKYSIEGIRPGLFFSFLLTELIAVVEVKK